ncbi:glycosyltransferase family 9 protein [bacterium]|nr:glycosyltransferase family 9 protein [bacterium]
MLMITPSVKALAEKYPCCSITLFTSTFGREIFCHDPLINRIYYLKHKHLPYFISIEKQRLIKQLKNIRFETVINFETNPSFSNLIKKIPAKNYIGWSDEMTTKIPFNLLESYWQNCINLLSPLGILKPESYLYIHTSKDDHIFFEEDIKSPIIGIHPGNSQIGKKRNVRAWFPERFAELIYKILNKYSEYKIVLTYKGKPEKKLIDNILSLLNISGDPHIRIAPQMTPQQFALFLKRYKLLVTTDTGVVNFAAAVGTPMVVLWGPGNFRLSFPPLREKRTKIIYHKINCSPCYGTRQEKRCIENKCMKNITVNEVSDAVDELMK